MCVVTAFNTDRSEAGERVYAAVPVNGTFSSQWPLRAPYNSFLPSPILLLAFPGHLYFLLFILNLFVALLKGPEDCRAPRVSGHWQERRIIGMSSRLRVMCF